MGTKVIKSALALPDISDAEAAALANRAQQGDVAAEHELVLRHTRLVLHMARLPRISEMPGLDVDDLFQAGIEVLIRCARNYCPNYGFSFCKWASLQLRYRLWKVVRREPLHYDQSIDWLLDEQNDVFEEENRQRQHDAAYVREQTASAPPESPAIDDVRRLCRAAEQQGLMGPEHTELVILRASGVPMEKAAEQLGMSRTTVYRRLWPAVGAAFNRLLECS